MTTTAAETAERFITRLEAVAEGDPFAREAREAEAAWAEVHAAVLRVIFPVVLPPAGVAELLQFRFAVDTMPREPMQAVEHLVEAHQAALDGGNGALAALLRGRVMQWWVGARGADAVAVLNGIERPVAAALVTAGEALPASRHLAETLPALKHRLDAELARRHALVAEAMALQRVEDEAVEQAQAQARREQRLELRRRVGQVRGAVLLRPSMRLMTVFELLQRIDDETTPAEQLAAIERAIESEERDMAALKAAQ